MANDFSTDSSCKALWRLESGALTADSKSSNTLTASSNPPDGATGAGNFQEGSCAGQFTRADNNYLKRTDTDLVTGFPFKSGDTTKLGTFCFWVKFSSITGSAVNAIIGKSSSNSGWDLRINTSGVLEWRWRYTFLGGGWGWSTKTAITPVTDRWYHISLVMNGLGVTDSNLRTLGIMYVYDSSTGNTTGYLLEPYDNGGTSYGLWMGTGAFYLGNSYNENEGFSGYLDEVVAFNRCVSMKELIDIRKGEFSIKTNDIPSDTNAVSLWPPTSGDVRNDFIGSNDLSYNLADYSQYPFTGNCQNSLSWWSCFLSSYNTSLYRTSALLSNSWPMKYGQSNNLGTIAFWVMFNNASASDTIVSHGNYSSYTNGWALKKDGSVFKLVWGRGSAETLTSTIAVANLVWYHVVLRMNATAPSASLRVYSAYADTVYTASWTPAGNMVYADNSFQFTPSAYNVKMMISEFCVFNDLLTDEEVDTLRNSTYTAVPPYGEVSVGTLNVEVAYALTALGKYRKFPLPPIFRSTQIGTIRREFP